MNYVLLYFFCIVPSIFFLHYIYKKDYMEKEPMFLLFILFGAGILACVLSIFTQTILIKIFPFLLFPVKKLTTLEIFFKTFVSIALVEESFKWLFLYFIAYHHKKIKHVYDLVVHASFVSLGFATLENIIYCYSYISQGLILVIARGLISIPCHLCLGVIMGHYISLAKEKKKRSFLFLSIFLPVLFHFFYNFFLMISHPFSQIAFGIFLALLFLDAFLIIEKKSRILINML